DGPAAGRCYPEGRDASRGWPYAPWRAARSVPQRAHTRSSPSKPHTGHVTRPARARGLDKDAEADGEPRFRPVGRPPRLPLLGGTPWPPLPEVRGPQDPEVRDETGDVPRGGHVEREVPRAAPLRRHRNARHREHLLLRPLLDRDRPAPARAEVHRR